jgi:predicted amidophosphoribosyltransferase
MIKIHPVRLQGRWQEGFALDVHTISSEFAGYDEFGHEQFNTHRSEIGEALYSLKYGQSEERLEEIIQATLAFLKRWNPNVSELIATPPSNQKRRVQPVKLVAKALVENLRLHSVAVKKTRVTAELKNIHDYDKRLCVLQEAYELKTGALSDKGVLLLDDLYQTGATLNAIAAMAYDVGNARAVYALALTRTRTRRMT